jgi:hypothetical protein
MAHELNNPSAAVLRGAKQMRDAIAELEKSHNILSTTGTSEAQSNRLSALTERIQQQATKPDELDLLTISDRSSELETWLDQRNVGDGWRYANALVTLGYSIKELEVPAEEFNTSQFSAVVAWLSSQFTIYSLLEEIGHGAEHITHIVKALRSYTYLDQAPVQSVDIYEGLDNTLVMLRGKLKGV